MCQLFWCSPGSRLLTQPPPSFTQLLAALPRTAPSRSFTIQKTTTIRSIRTKGQGWRVGPWSKVLCDWERVENSKPKQQNSNGLQLAQDVQRTSLETSLDSFRQSSCPALRSVRYGHSKISKISATKSTLISLEEVESITSFLHVISTHVSMFWRVGDIWAELVATPCWGRFEGVFDNEHELPVATQRLEKDIYINLEGSTATVAK